MRGIILLFSLVLSLYAQSSTSKPPVYNFTKQEGIDLVNSLFKACNPDLPQNTYMPSLLREKLRWVYLNKIGRRLETQTVFNENGEFGGIAMFAGYSENGIPHITIVVDDVLLSVRVDNGVKTGFNQMSKNSFCMELAHEATHLEKSKAFLLSMNRTKRIQEEFRVYKKLESVVFELRAKKEPLDREHVEIYEIVSKCPGLTACPAFVEHFSQRAKSIPGFPKN